MENLLANYPNTLMFIGTIITPLACVLLARWIQK